MPPETSLVSPPQQVRSRRAWARILDTGEQILATEGLEGFTIGAICARAQVSSAAIYSRVAGKDALFIAVYERVLEHMTQEREEFVGLSRDEDLTLEELIRRTVATFADLFLRRAGFVRSVVWLSNTNEEVRLRGSEWMTQLGREFTELLVEHDDSHSLSLREIDMWYRVLWSTVVIYISHGPGYASEKAISDAEFVEELTELAVRYLIGARD